MNSVLLVSPKGRLADSPLPNAQLVADLHGKRIDDAMRLYTDDAVVVNPDGSVVRAGAELRGFYEQVTGATDSDTPSSSRP